jgi:hypothetical protein
MGTESTMADQLVKMLGTLEYLEGVNRELGEVYDSPIHTGKAESLDYVISALRLLLTNHNVPVPLVNVRQR